MQKTYLDTKYARLIQKIYTEGTFQSNKKGGNRFLLNQQLALQAEELDFENEARPIAKRKLAKELELFMAGETRVSEYQAQGISWWDYCGEELVNSYPKYFKKLPALIEKINKEKRSSKNYVLYIGETGVETSQLPCVSLIQFQIIEGKLYITTYIRSSDASLGLPSDIYQLSLIAKMIDVPLAQIHINLANVHIYRTNWGPTVKYLSGDRDVKFVLNV